jgi:UDPglucose 6-dehydrogenase
MNELYSIGLVGYGFVGKAVSMLMTNKKCISNIKTHVYDPAYKEHATPSLLERVLNSDFVFLCLPTPTNSETGELDTSLIEKYVDKHSKLCKNPNSVIVVKSTVAPGSCDAFQEKTLFPVIHNPEFLTQRTHIKDFMSPLDIVIGSTDLCFEVNFKGEIVKPHKALAEVYTEFYSKIEKNGESNSIPSIIFRTNTVAEMIKIIRNSFYATKISFMNEVYDLCNAFGENYEDLRSGLTSHGRHPWWCDMHTFVPGPDGKCGYGGACFPKDTKGLYSKAKELGVEMNILRASIEHNKQKRGV